MTTEQKLLKKIKREQEKWKSIAREGIKEPNLKGVSDALDEYYFINKLKVYCAYLSYTQYVASETLPYQVEDFRFIKAILNTVDSEEFDNPTFEIYNKIRRLFETIEKENEDTNKLYLATYELIKKHASLFDKEENLDLYSFLTNYCIRKINAGIANYKERFFLINNEIINLKYRNQKIKQTSLPATLYKNMIITASLLKDATLFSTISTMGVPKDTPLGFSDGIAWAERFTETYQSKLDKKNRKMYYAYCSAFLSFIQDDYLQAYQKLGNPSHLHGIQFNLEVKMLHLKIVYEVNRLSPEKLEEDGVEIRKVMEAYRGSIRYELDKKRQLNYQIDFFVAFEKVFKKLYPFYEKYSGKLYNATDQNYIKDKELLLEQAKSLKYTYKNWFKSKIEEI